MTHRCLTALSIALLSASAAMAQPKNDGRAVSAEGTSTLTLRPKVLRMQLELTGRGKDLKTAMANLKDRREAAKLQLATLKADPKSITFSPPTKSGMGGQQEQQMRAMIMQRAREKGGAVPELPAVVALSAGLTAEWTLTGDDDDTRIVAAGELCDKITAADIAGTKEKKTLTPEQQEVQEELAQMSSRYGGEGQASPGEPQFLYVAEVTDEQAAQALADAFNNAKQQAGRIAKAVGYELGPLRRVDNSHVSAYGGNMDSDEYYSARMYRMAMARNMEGMLAKPNEVISQDPNRAPYRVSIGCEFEVGK